MRGKYKTTLKHKKEYSKRMNRSTNATDPGGGGNSCMRKKK